MNESKNNNENKSITEREKAEINCWLTEFKALRDEISVRFTNQRQAILFNITTIGIIFSAVFTLVQEPPILLLSIPFISTSFGLYFLNQNYTMITIANYIRERIKPNLIRLTKNKEVLDWEHYTRKTNILSNREITYHIALLLIFSFPSIASLIANYEFSNFEKNRVLAIIWWLGIILIILFIYSFINRYKYWKKKR